MGLNLQLSLLLDGLLTAIMAAAFAPKPNISPSLQLESKADARGCTQIIVCDLNLPFHYPTLPVETVLYLNTWTPTPALSTGRGFIGTHTGIWTVSPCVS